MADLINLDPTAKWDPSSGVVNSCAPSEACGLVSPRIVIVTVFDPAYFKAAVNYSGQPDLKVINILYLFIDGVVGGNGVYHDADGCEPSLNGLTRAADRSHAHDYRHPQGLVLPESEGARV